MAKAARIKERKLKFENDHPNFNEEYKEALEQLESVE